MRHALAPRQLRLLERLARSPVLLALDFDGTLVRRSQLEVDGLLRRLLALRRGRRAEREDAAEARP